MVEKLRKRMASEESGFTLVELLVVMLILGLLAAIAIPSFFNQRDKARDADAKSSARTAQTAIETYATDNGGAYTGATAGTATDDLNVIEPTLNDVGTRLAVDSAADKAYSITVTSEVTGQSFTIARADTGVTTLTCNTDGKAGCPSDGTWD
jgi:type IV pilus assembly protein PilA